MSQYYLGIENPDRLRRDLLETAKLSVTVLKAQYRLKELRSQKMAKIEQLREAVTEIDAMMDKLQKALPEHNRDNLPEAAKRAMEQAQRERKLDEDYYNEPLDYSEPQAEPEESIEEVFDEPVEEEPLPRARRGRSPAPVSDDYFVDPVESAEQLGKLEEKLSLIESKLNKL